MADLGDCPLENGEVIRGCRLGYRLYGRLAPDGSNAILIPTPFTGTSEELVRMVRPLGLTNNSNYFLILVDAFGNGVSSSPSNSSAQAGSAFPQITIRDMAAAEYRLMTEVLGVRSLHAIIGISMGGMQGFEWTVSYPDFVERFIAVLSSPRLASYDIVLWKTLENALALYQQCECEEAARTVGGLGFLVGNSPNYHARLTPRDSLAGALERIADQPLSIGVAQDITSQLQAMIEHNIAAPFDDSLELAAARVQARVLVIVSPVDHVVTPGPAREFAEVLGAEVVELGSDCGHNGFGCDALQAAGAILRFLANDR
jgi:homoserine O-acetyltransferase